MLTRITITLAADEREALRQLAEHEVRGLKDHIRYILRQEVERRGAHLALAQETHQASEAVRRAEK